MRAALLAGVLLLVGCATPAPTLEQTFWASRAAFNETHAGYNRFIQADNTQVVSCYLAHKGTKPADLKLKCPPAVSLERRQQALVIIQSAQTELTELDMAFQVSPDIDAKFISEGLGKLESLSLQLILMSQEGH